MQPNNKQKQNRIPNSTSYIASKIILLPTLHRIVKYCSNLNPAILDQCSLWWGTWRAGDPAWEPSRLPGPEWAGQMPSAAPLLLLRSWRAPPACLSCSPPASFLCPQDQCGLERAYEGTGPGPRAGQTSLADWAGETLGVLPPDSSPRVSLQAWEPLSLLSHPSGVPVLSGLHFSTPLSPRTSYWFTWGSSHLLGR